MSNKKNRNKLGRPGFLNRFRRPKTFFECWHELEAWVTGHIKGAHRQAFTRWQWALINHADDEMKAYSEEFFNQEGFMPATIQLLAESVGKMKETDRPLLAELHDQIPGEIIASMQPHVETMPAAKDWLSMLIY